MPSGRNDSGFSGDVIAPKRKPVQDPAPVKPKMTKEQRAAYKRHLFIKEKRRRAELRKQAFSRFLRSLFVFFSLTLIFISLYVLYVFLQITFRPRAEISKYPVAVKASVTDKKFEIYDTEEVYIGDTPYLAMSAIEKVDKITVFGDYTIRSFLIQANGEYANFYVDTANVEINGEIVFMNNKCVLKNGKLYIPLDFYTDRMKGFTLTFDKDKNRNVLTYYPEIGLSFTIKAPVTEASIPQSAIPAK